MGTHPIFESDFDCLTECEMKILCVAEKNDAAKNIASQLRQSF